MLKKPLFATLWTTEFGKVDPIFHSVMIINVPRVGTYTERFKDRSFCFRMTVVDVWRRALKQRI